jgi:hypothetical protein
MGGKGWSGITTSAQIVGSDGSTKIGNSLDWLKVETKPASVTSTTPSWSKFLRYVDMNVASGGIARGTSIATSTTWRTIFNYTGSGFLAAFLVNVETFTGWEFRLIIDSQDIFILSDADITSDSVYDLDDITDTNQAFIGLSKGAHDRFIWHSPLSSPVYYANNVTIQIRRPIAGAKKFQAGLVILSKET